MNSYRYSPLQITAGLYACEKQVDKSRLPVTSRQQIRFLWPYPAAEAGWSNAGPAPAGGGPALGQPPAVVMGHCLVG